MKKISTPTFLFSIFLVLAITISTYFYFKSKKFTEISPRRGNLTEAVYALGKVKSHKRFEVMTGFMSSVKKLYVEEGDEIEKNQLIVELESGTIFRSPFNGTVTLVRLQEGETVLPQTPIIRVEDLTDRFIEISIEQESALKVRKGQGVKIAFEDLKNEIFQGRIISLFPREDEFLAHVEILELDHRVLPGMTADVAIKIAEIKNALLIPVKSISNNFVEILKKKKWKKIKLEFGPVEGDWIQVLGNQLSEKDVLKVKRIR
jgi:macrolide-specific efflux system membrane fusion protein